MVRFLLGIVVAVALLGMLPYVVIAATVYVVWRIVRRPRYVMVGTVTYGRKGNGR